MDKFIIEFSEYNNELESVSLSYNNHYYETVLNTYKQLDTVLELLIINEITLSDFFMSLYEISRTHIDALYVIYDMEESIEFISDEEAVLIYDIYKNSDDTAINALVNNQLSTIISVFKDLKEHKMNWLTFLHIISDISYINIIGLQQSSLE